MSKYYSKNIILIITLFFSIFIFYGNFEQPEIMNEYNGIIEHLTFNTLISFPEKTLNPENHNNTLIDSSKITPIEFKNILKQLYSNNYILINIDDLFFIENNNIYSKPLYIPKNKKPLIISFNNVNYKSSFQNYGEIDKIIVDNEGNFATYSTKKNIQDRISYDNEFLPILEDFIQTNPDFSHNNARGIIFFTIDNGVLGYQIDSKYNSSKHDLKRLSELIKRLSFKGWKFGSNNYSYVYNSSLNEMEFAKHLTLWNKNAKPIVGDIHYFSAPFGEKINNTALIEILNNNGFQFIFYDDFLNKLEIKNNSVFMSRKLISGETLRNNSNELKELFDCKNVYDSNNRLIPFPN